MNLTWIGPAISAIAAIAAWFSAIGSSRSARIAKESILNAQEIAHMDLLRQFIDERCSEELYTAKLSLRDWETDHRGGQKDFATALVEERDTPDTRGRGMDRHRRRVFMYVRKAYDYKEMGLLHDDDMLKLFNRDDLAFFFEISVPIEDKLSIKRSGHPLDSRMKQYFEELMKRL